MKREWCIFLVIAAIALLVAVYLKQSAAGPPPIYRLEFAEGERIEIQELDWVNSIMLSNRRSGRRFLLDKKEGATWSGGASFKELDTQIRNGKWQSGNFSLEQPATIIVARALDTTGAPIVSHASLEHTEGIKEVQFEENGAFHALLRDNQPDLDWGLEFDLGNGEFLPFNGPLTPCRDDTRAISWHSYTPASALRIRGRIGDQVSKIIELDTSHFTRSPVTIEDDQVPTDRDLGECLLAINGAEVIKWQNGQKEPDLDYSFIPKTKEQSNKSWDYFPFIVIGDELGNRSNRSQFLPLPGTKKIIFELPVIRSPNYHWHQSEVAFIAEGQIPSNANVNNKAEFPPLALIPFDDTPASFQWSTIRLQVHDRPVRHRDPPEWQVQISGSADKEAIDNLRQSAYWTIFVDDADYSTGVPSRRSTGSSQTASGITTFDYKLPWRGTLLPGQLIRVAIVYPPAPKPVTFSLPRSLFDGLDE